MFFLKKYRIEVLGFLVAGILALSSFWSLHEDDIFWQIRAGSEIIKNHSVQTIDTWSYSVKGDQWINYQWLSDVLFYSFYNIGGEESLIVLRVVLIFLWFFIIALVIGRVPDVSLSVKAMAILLLLPVSYVSSQFRLHLRPETFCIILFCMQILFWTIRKPVYWQIPFVLLASNFHAGTAIFNLVLAFLLIVFSVNTSTKNKIIFAVLCFLSFFATPIHFHIVKQLLIHSRYDTKLFFNKEWQSFDFVMLNVKRYGWMFMCWFAILIAGTCSVIFKKELLKDKVVVIFFVIITLLSFKYIRTIPYHVIFLIPLITSGMDKLSKAVKYSALFIFILIVFTWAVVLPNQVFKYSSRWGLSVNSELFPVSITRFITENNIQPRIFADPQASSYFLWFLPQYESYIDHRDVIFNRIKKEFVNASINPVAMQAILSKYKVNAVVNRYSKGRVLPDGKVQNPLDNLYPKKEWALVYFTNSYVMFVRRIPEHEEVIDEFEYKILSPGMPAAFFAFKKEDSETTLELYRCLKEEPRNFFCRTIFAAKKIKTRSKENLREALTILDDIEKMQDINDYRLDIHHYTLKWQIYNLLGDKQKAAEIENKIAELTR